MRKLKITAKTAEEASAIYCQLRDQDGGGASTMPEGLWNGHTISYNGRVWNKDGKAVYPTRENSPDYWQASCA